MLAPNDAVADKMRANIEQVRARGGPVLCVGNDARALEVAKEAAGAGGAASLAWWRADPPHERKSDDSPVSQADRDADAARHQGLRTRSINLFIFGGVALLEKDPRDGQAELRIAAAGPLVSLVLAGLFYACATLPFVGPSVAAVAKYLALINLILALFNLVPAFPMDGGRLLRGALWGSMGKVRR